MAVVTKISSPQTTGLDNPSPGIEVFQITFVPRFGDTAGVNAAELRPVDARFRRAWRRRDAEGQEEETGRNQQWTHGVTSRRQSYRIDEWSNRIRLSTVHCGALFTVSCVDRECWADYSSSFA
jgi:hypothetical protein